MLALAMAMLSLPALAQSPMHVGTTQCWRITGTQGWSPLPDTCFQTEDAAGAAMVPLFNATWRVGCFIYTFEAQRYSFPNGVWPPFTTVFVHGTESAYWPASGCGGEPGSSHSESYRVGYIARPDGCPPHSAPDLQLPGAPCRCDQDFAANTARDRCYPVIVRYRFPEPPECGRDGDAALPKLGNPILPLSATKSQSEMLGTWLGQTFSIHYDTREKIATNLTTDFLTGVPPSFGGLWRSNLHRSLKFHKSAAGTVLGVVAHRGGWTSLAYLAQPSGEFLGPPDRQDRLWPDGSRWLYRDSAGRSVEVYDSEGRLLEVAMADGGGLRFEYSPGATPGVLLLTRVSDQTGRAVTWDYEQPGAAGAQPRVVRLTAPDGQDIRFGYDSRGQLVSVTHEGTPARTFHYELPQLPWALTGLTAEDGVRLATYGFDANGRATSTEHAGGVGRFSVAYDQAPRWEVQYTIDEVQQVVYRDLGWSLPAGARATLPDGSMVGFGFETVNGLARLVSQSQPAGSGCAASTRTVAHDAFGNVERRDEFNGARTCYARDAMGRETTRVEGLAGTAVACSAVSPGGSALPGGARKVSTQRLAGWNRPTRVAEPGRVTTYVYHGQPDPFNAMATAACAVGAPALRGGEPLALLCARVEQATVDSQGALAFMAAIDTAVPSRTWRWTYDAQGRVLSTLEPGGVLTSMRYHDTSGSGHRAGDLHTVTNAAGHTTTFTRHDGNGNWLEQVDANGVLTTRAFDTRRRLTSLTVAGLTRQLSYWPSGQLYRATEADGSFVEFQYDAAQRLVAVVNSNGQRIDYTLDAAGRRMTESASDGAGVL